ncbi:MAG: hypothetical protein EXR07_10335 [Acetobacteraceae bacterium]|nr:hypothetical protein [Acetobacteraceae bacterium]
MGKSAPSNETLAHWLKRETVPLPTTKDAFLNVFFPKAAAGDARDKADREELSAAWEAAWYKRRVAPRQQRRDPPAPPPASEWKAVPGAQFEGLVEFDLDDPVPSNDGLGWHRVPAILRFGATKRPWQNGLVTLSLFKAYLAVLETGYQVAGGRLIGNSGPLPHDRFKRETGFSEVLGPKNASGHLDDWVLEEPHPIAVVRPVSDGAGSVTAQIVAWPIEFDVAPALMTDGTSAPVDINKTAVLKALVLEGCERDGHGRVVLAKRQLERKAAE